MKEDSEFNEQELNLIKKLNTPAKIQDFINELNANFEEQGETCMSPLRVLRTRRAHCIEGAFLAAACIWINKIGIGKPLIVDMKGTEDDWDHVVAVFKIDGKFGAISKTNHAVLRYREPVYDSIRELIMSYFHEYTSDDKKGNKTLRSYSDAIDLSKFFGKEWVTSQKDLWAIHDFIDKVKHHDILNKNQISQLRKADAIEIAMGDLRDWSKGKQNPNKWAIGNI